MIAFFPLFVLLVIGGVGYLYGRSTTQESGATLPSFSEILGGIFAIILVSFVIILFVLKSAASCAGAILG